MKQLISFCSLVCLLAFVGCAKDEVDTTGTIAGLVTSFSNANQPIAGASVTLSAKGIAKTTGSDGRFEFTDIEPGTYTLQVQANGYQPTTKQATVYAGQTVTCDVQLEKAAQSNSVIITPENVVFGGNMETNTFTISNNTNQSLSYSISNLPDYLQAVPVSASIAAKGKQTIVLTVLNRSTITAARSDKFLVNVGNDSYPVSVMVDAYQSETVSVSITPTSLSFDKNTDNLSFTMHNNNTYDHTFTITTNLDVLTIAPQSGTLTAKGNAQVGVTVKNRQAVTLPLMGSLTIIAGGNTYNVSVSIDKYEEDNPEDEPVVARGLLAYYTFNDGTADDVYENANHGKLKGEGSPDFITDTPNKKGKALSLKSDQYVDIPTNLLKGKQAFSICLWLKNFGTGPLFTTLNNGLSSPSLLLRSEETNVKLSLLRYYDYQEDFNSSLSNYQSSGWHHIAVTAFTDKEAVLYIDGTRIDSKSIGFLQGVGNKMQIGGNADGHMDVWADAMKLDNVRVHSVQLKDDEIKQIYEAEK